MNWKVILICLLILLSLVLAHDLEEEEDELSGPEDRFKLKKKKKHKKKHKNKHLSKFLTVTTTTETSIYVSTGTVSAYGLCAKLVNVTGPCRLRRGMWVEEPVVLTFDDGMDDIDTAFSPSKIHRIETTALPAAPEAMEQAARQGRANVDMVTDVVLEPSTPTTPSYEDYDAEEGDSDDPEYDPDIRDDDVDPENRIGFKHFFKKIIKNKFKHHLVTVIKTTTVTDTYTTYVTTTVSTKTFFIQKCTPTPFTFTLCTKTN